MFFSSFSPHFLGVFIDKRRRVGGAGGRLATKSLAREVSYVFSVWYGQEVTFFFFFSVWTKESFRNGQVLLPYLKLRRGRDVLLVAHLAISAGDDSGRCVLLGHLHHPQRNQVISRCPRIQGEGGVFLVSLCDFYRTGANGVPSARVLPSHLSICRSNKRIISEQNGDNKCYLPTNPKWRNKNVATLNVAFNSNRRKDLMNSRVFEQVNRRTSSVILYFLVSSKTRSNQRIRDGITCRIRIHCRYPGRWSEQTGSGWQMNFLGC